MRLQEDVRYAVNKVTGVTLVYAPEMASNTDIRPFTHSARVEEPLLHDIPPSSKKDIDKEMNGNIEKADKNKELIKAVIIELRGGEVDNPSDYASGGIPKIDIIRRLVESKGGNGAEVIVELRNEIWADLLAE